MAYIARTLTSLGRGVAKTVQTARWISTGNNTANIMTKHVTRLPSVTTLQFCPIRQRHTEGDKELISFLEEEIQEEQNAMQEIPTIGKFKMSTDGTLVTLEQTVKGEIVTVAFDVNKSVNVPIEMGEEDIGEDMGGGIMSYPEFSVSITKPSGNTLKVNCNCQDLEEHEDDEEGESEVLRIDSVLAYNGADKVDLATVYEAEGENMDEGLYEMLLKTLHERGVDEEFANNLIELSTAVEHGMYLKHLESLNAFVKERN